MIIYLKNIKKKTFLNLATALKRKRKKEYRNNKICKNSFLINYYYINYAN